jgi:hypothetical protein
MASISISNADFTGVSFADAFESARNELGFPSIFYWEGKPFHTGTKEEIDSMSPEEWSAFSTSIKDSLTDFDPSSALNSLTADQAKVYVPDNLAGGFQPDTPPEISEMLARLGGTASSSSPQSLEEEIGGLMNNGSMFTSTALQPENGLWDVVTESIGGFFKGLFDNED